MFPVAQNAYCFDIGDTASSQSYLTPKLANVVENPSKRVKGISRHCSDAPASFFILPSSFFNLKTPGWSLSPAHTQRFLKNRKKRKGWAARAASRSDRKSVV